MIYVDICTNCWQVLKCAQASLLLLNTAVNGRIFLPSSNSLQYLFSFETLQHCHHQLLKMPVRLQNLFQCSILSQLFQPHSSTNPNPFILLSPFCLFAQWWILNSNTSVTLFLFVKQISLYNSSLKCDYQFRRYYTKNQYNKMQ